MHETEGLESKIEEICQDSDKAAAVLKVATQTIGLFIINICLQNVLHADIFYVNI